MSAPAPGALEAVLGAVARRRRLETALRGVLEAGGYTEVAVPLLQPSEGGADWEAAYRVLDPDGAVLDLRPDVTGPVARLCAVGDTGGPRPRRLWYLAAIFRRAPGEAPREMLQAGAERIGGASGPQEDAELLALTARCLSAVGAERWMLAVGHVGYVRERLEAVGAPVDPALAALRRRDLVGLAEIAGARVAEELGWRGPVREALDGGLRGGGPAAEDLRQLLGRLATQTLPGGAVLVEPGLILPGAYYTGMVFETLVPGAPAPVGDGGRYDGLLGRWGQPEPAVGFAFDCDRLLTALDGEAAADGVRRAWAAVRAPAAEARAVDGANGGGRP